MRSWALSSICWGLNFRFLWKESIKQFANLTTPLALFVLGGTLHFNAIGGNLKYVVPSMTVKMGDPAGSDSGGCDAARLFRCGTFCLL